jgi:ribonuclease J
MLSEIKKNNLINIHDINDKFLPLKASNEDHKFLVSFLHPKYIIPHSGLYMDFVNYKQAIKLTGFKLENVSLLKNNGTIIEFNNGELINQNEKIELQTKIINSYGTYDNSTSSILERNQMKENGIVIVNFSIDPNKLEIRDYKYNIIGVSGEENNHSKIKDLEDEINGKVNVIFKEELSKEPFNIKEIKNKIKRIILKKIGNIFDKEPIVLTTILYNKITIED